MLSHRFVAVILEFFGKGAHRGFKLLIRLFTWLCDRSLLVGFVYCVDRHRLSSLGFLLLKFHLLALLNIILSWWLASVGRRFRIIWICNVASTPNFAAWLSFPTGSIFVLLRLFLFRFLDILLCSVGLHDVVDQIIEIFLVHLFISSRQIILLWRLNTISLLPLLTRRFPVPGFSLYVGKKVVSSNASAHTAPVNCTLFMLFELLTIVVIVAANWMLLNLLLLLHLVV